MFLEKLTIQGFKSFANKNVLIFPGMMGKTKRGITAVVGPNGSGKSNIADSVRWSLGEQSMKTLRGKKFEDVIFSGSDKKGRLGMSEVSLYLNNEDKKAPIDYEKVILTRRLFRDGESEYLINNSRVRLADIQIMLAKANFGQKTYSVIGQGVVEGFLNTSLAERKEFFDEATGVKQFQIKRDDSLNKLRISHENLGQIKMLLDEIEPRLKSLTRQVNKLQKRGQLEVELKGLQLKYYAKIWHSLNDKFNQVNKQFIALEQEKRKKEEKLKQLTGELDKISAENKVVEDFNKLQDQVNELQAAKDKIIQQLAKYDARTEVSLEARGKFDLAWLHSKKADLAKEIAQKNEEIKILESNIVSERNHWQELDEEKKQFDNKINKLNNILSGLNSDVDKQKIEDINGKLKNFLSQLDKAEGEKNLNKIKEIISNLRETVKKLLSILGKTSPKEDLDKIHKDIINLTEAKEIIVNKINESNLRILARSERVKLLKIETKKINTDLSEIEQKLKEEDIKDKKGEFANQKKELKDKLNKIEQKLKEVNEKVINFTKEEEDKKDRLFLLQKNWQTLQSEVSQTASELNELKINSARYETKLEDLEIEIRHNYGNLSEIKNNQAVKGDLDDEEAIEKINILKRQLDLIGGIDPEIAKEYNETKTRFDFLFSQVNDLTEAIKSLEEIVKELDINIKEKFDKEFKIITTKFEEYFKILFNGGTAKIIKLIEAEKNGLEKEEMESGEKIATSINKIDQKFNVNKIKFLQKHNATGLAGIEIQATPPGKKIKSVSMLSGGERALTAIALICAIISANPSPFVVLDEVDAALDEANSERLAKILDDLSHKTQFIIITHNRATMRRANILYGVTMGDDGISKLLSVKLEEASEKLAPSKVSAD